MPIICGVRFRGGGKVYYFDPGELSLQVDDYVIVSTSRGDELAQVVMANREAQEGEIVGELKPVLRRATSLDLLQAERYRQKEAEAVEECQKQVDAAGLEMKIVGAEYSYDGSRLTFYFTSDKRVDFRQLVRDLARSFKARIELRQIGVRDEAKLLGGLGPCGRPLCCATWLTQFTPVSIRMAKQQNLPLSPMEISGLCGRLLCCLTYEDDYYREIKGRFPRVGRTVESPYGPGKVVKVCVFKEKVTLLLEDGAKVELTADQLAGIEPVEPRAEKPLRRESLDATLRAQETLVAREQRPSDEGRRRNAGQEHSRGESGGSQARANDMRARPREGAAGQGNVSGAADARQRQTSGEQGRTAPLGGPGSDARGRRADAREAPPARKDRESGQQEAPKRVPRRGRNSRRGGGAGGQKGVGDAH